jgi:LPS export ABC transporter protein LptC
MPEGKVSRFLRVISALLVFFTVWLLWARELDGFTPGRDGRLAVPDYAMTNARYVSVKEGRVELESRAKEAAFDLTEHRMDAKDVTAYFYSASQQKTEVTADRAQFYMDERRLHLESNVRSVSPDGFELRGPEAEYRIEKHLLLAPRPVEGELASQKLKVWGDKAESDLDQRTVELMGNARAEYIEKKRGLTRVRGDSALLERDKQMLSFRRHVRMEQSKLVATSGRAEVFYSPREKNVRYLSLLDDVKIQEQGGRYTRSQVAEFFAPTDTIVLSQFPTVYHGDDVVTGDRITLYRTTGVVEVTATNALGGNPKAPKAQPFTKEDEELIP